jgi:IS605 OrfB family transposase
VIAVDINADHLAVAETDRYGNYIDSFILPFSLSSLSSRQAKAIIGDAVATIVDHCLRKSKPLILEDLDFSKKKSDLKALPKFRRKYLSHFAYASFLYAFKSKARRLGVDFISIDPAYTSLIGAYKYQGLNISSHEKAALAIARRAQSFTEELGVFQGTLPSQVMMTERTKFRESPRPALAFYADNRQRIRKLLIDEDRRPLLPLRRAFSLVGCHSSLKRSYFVIREEREFKELRCSLG